MDESVPMLSDYIWTEIMEGWVKVCISPYRVFMSFVCNVYLYLNYLCSFKFLTTEFILNEDTFVRLIYIVHPP